MKVGTTNKRGHP